MNKKLNDLVLLLQLIVIMFLAYTIWQLQIDVSILYNMLIELEELILDTSEDMGDVLDNGWNA
jgi:regulatory protein YycH of two-component signal transduction system YycFG|tara:strand:+ start:970 stop:1158 length:189 start_codon:yes stop_codon:yes gene_type:complete